MTMMLDMSILHDGRVHVTRATCGSCMFVVCACSESYTTIAILSSHHQRHATDELNGAQKLSWMRKIVPSTASSSEGFSTTSGEFSRANMGEVSLMGYVEASSTNPG